MLYVMYYMLYIIYALYAFTVSMELHSPRMSRVSGRLGALQNNNVGPGLCMAGSSVMVADH